MVSVSVTKIGGALTVPYILETAILYVKMDALAPVQMHAPRACHIPSYLGQSASVNQIGVPVTALCTPESALISVLDVLGLERSIAPCVARMPNVTIQLENVSVNLAGLGRSAKCGIYVIRYVRWICVKDLAKLSATFASQMHTETTVESANVTKDGQDLTATSTTDLATVTATCASDPPTPIASPAALTRTRTPQLTDATARKTGLVHSARFGKAPAQGHVSAVPDLTHKSA